MVLRHTAALATDVVSGPSQGFQSTTAEEIQMSSQNEIQARLHCVSPPRLRHPLPQGSPDRRDP